MRPTQSTYFAGDAEAAGAASVSVQQILNFKYSKGDELTHSAFLRQFELANAHHSAMEVRHVGD